MKPAELRAVAEAANHERYLEEQRILQEEKEERKIKMEESMTEGLQRISDIETTLEVKARMGHTSYKMFWAEKPYRDNDYNDLVRPALQVAIDHFVKLGFKVEEDLEHTTDWYNGESGPGPTKIYLYIDWSE